MARVAIVTGGTRGIAVAISVTLKDEGFSVAAIYAGNDEAANAFNEETGTPIYKTNVSDFVACEAGVARIVADLGPIDVLVNNAGITRDGTLHCMTPTKWEEVTNTNLGSCFNMSHCAISGMQERKFGWIVNVASINGQADSMGRSITQRRNPASAVSRKLWRRKVLAWASR